MSRWVCIDDLKNYFKRLELLGGLTEPEKEQLRKNIGITEIGENGNSEVEKVTYSQLLEKVLRKSLISSRRYAITDYLTIYLSNHLTERGIYETWGKSINPSKVYTLIVTALTEDTLDKRIIILEHPEWYAEYDITLETLNDGLVTKGKITFLKDSNNNSAYYDFKNVKFSRIENNIQINYYTFSNKTDTLSIGDASELKETYNNLLGPDCWNNVFMGDTYNNVLDAGSCGNTFYKGCNDCHFTWDTCNNTFKCKVCYLSGTMGGKYIPAYAKVLESSLTKLIHIVEENTVITFLDTVTYAWLVIPIENFKEEDLE